MIITSELHLHVRDAAELLEEISGEKGDDSVLGGDNLVRCIDMIFRDSLFLVVVFWREIFVDEDGAWGPWLPFARE